MLFRKRWGGGAEGERVPFYVNRSYALLWAGQAASNMGDFLFTTTVILWIAADLARGQPWAPIAVSGVLAANVLPVVLVGPVAGVFVDRWPKRRTMLVMDAARTALLLLLLAATVLLPGRVTLVHLATIYVVVIVENACAQFFRPSQVGLVGDIVAEPYRAQATGLEWSTRNMSLVLGPSLAALLFAFGASWAFLIDALSFAVSFAAIGLVRAPTAGAPVRGTRRDFGREFADGLRFSLGSPVIRVLIIAAVIWVLGIGAFNALNVFFTVQNLGQPTRLYGFLNSALGVGGIGGALAAASITRFLGLTRTLALALLVTGLLFAVYSRLTVYPAALTVIAMIGITNAIGNVTVRPLLLATAPRQLIGRVTAIFTPTVSLATSVSVAVSGAIADLLYGFHARVLAVTLGPIDTVFLGAAALSVIGAVYAAIGFQHARREGTDE